MDREQDDEHDGVMTKYLFCTLNFEVQVILEQIFTS